MNFLRSEFSDGFDGYTIIKDSFTSEDKQVVNLQITENGLYVALILGDGESRLRWFLTMYVAKRFFYRLKDKYGKR